MEVGFALVILPLFVSPYNRLSTRPCLGLLHIAPNNGDNIFVLFVTVTVLPSDNRVIRLTTVSVPHLGATHKINWVQQIDGGLCSKNEKNCIKINGNAFQV